MELTVTKKINLAVLISGRGSNLQSIIDACAHDSFPAETKLVISNEPEAYGLERAKAANIPTVVIPHKSFPSRKEFEAALQEKLSGYPIDLICLAGFMRVLTADFVAKWDGRMLNIHPSLLPAYAGLHTHERVLAAKEKESGCTIHFVTPGLDEGPTLLQKRVPVLPTDSAETLAGRILAEEHIAYPEAIRLIALGKVTYNKDHVEIGEADPYIPPQPEPKPLAEPVAKPVALAPEPAVNPARQSAHHEEKPPMDHHSATPGDIDPAAVAHSQATFGEFVKAAKYVVIGVAAILIFMALTLV